MTDHPPSSPQLARALIVMAASAGGIESLRRVLGGLPPDLRAAVLVVLHIPPDGGQALPRILDRAGPLRAAAAVDGEEIYEGRIYVCVGDRHLIVAPDHVHLRRGPRENGHRPAADALFRSAARHYERDVIAVVLSGTLSDGTAGLRAVRRRGGTAVVQSPADALHAGMPESAIEYAGADHIADAADIGPLLAVLTDKLVTSDGAPTNSTAPAEVIMNDEPTDEPTDQPIVGSNNELNDTPIDGATQIGMPSQWPCPDCSGVLWTIDGDDGSGDLYFRCRVGHSYGVESLREAQRLHVEGALFTALRSLEDRAALNRTLAERAEDAERHYSARRFRSEVEGFEHSIAVIRRLLEEDHSDD